MAAENPPFAVQADSHGAELFRLAVGSALPPHVRGLSGAQGGVVNPGDLAVSAGTGNSLNVAAGQVWIPGNQGAHQGLYFGYNDATVNLAVTPNGSNPLVALVTASMNDQAYAGNPGVTNNQWGLLVTQGTPGSSPAVPTVPNNSIVLATVLVPAGASSSSSYTIVQGLGTISGVTLSAPLGQTTPVTIGAPGGAIYSTGAQSIPNATATLCTGMAVNWLRGGMTLGSNGLVVPAAGIYHMTASVQWSNNNTTVYITYLYKNGSNAGTVRSGVGYGNPSSAGLMVVQTDDDVICNAGDVLQVACQQNAGGPVGTASGNPNYGTSLTAHLVSF